MKKLFLFIAFVTISALQIALAQCTPIPFSGPSFTNPDTSDVIPPAAETQFYSQVIHVRIPEDTMLNGLVIKIDSAGIQSITGMPSSLSWISNTPNNYWPGDTFGCVIIQGTPIVGESGNYTVSVTIAVHAFGQAMPFTLDYDVEILSQTYAGINAANKDEMQVFQNQPNPFNNRTDINYYSPKDANISFKVYDIVGNTVLKRSLKASHGKNTISFNRNSLSSGIYIYEFKSESKTIRKRMIIE